MSRAMKVYRSGDLARVEFAELLLRQARELLKAAGAARTVARVRLAITSAGGAYRHARNRRVRALKALRYTPPR